MRKIDQLFKDADMRYYEKYDAVETISQRRLQACLIRKGYAVVYQKLPQGKRKILHVLKPGDIFPVAAEIASMSTPDIRIEAHTPLVVAMTERKQFYKTISANHEMLSDLTRILSDYLIIYVERVENLEMETVEKKVIGRLLHFAARFGKKAGNITEIELPITHEFIAQSINVARENVSREVRKLVTEGIIEARNNHILIRNEKKLQQKLLQ